MLSILVNKKSNPKIRKSPSSPQTAKPTKNIKTNMALLDAYSSTNALNDTLMKTFKGLYKNRDITNIRTATAAMELLKGNEMKKFSKKFAGISKLVSKKTAKTTARRDAKHLMEKEEMDRTVRGVEREVFRPRIKTKDGETEAPTYEVEFIRDYRNIIEAWEAGEKKLIQLTEST